MILRLVSPREFPRRSGESHDQAIEKMNRLLGIDGLEVYMVGVEPKLRSVQPFVASEEVDEASGTGEFETAPPPTFSRFIEDGSLSEILIRRWDEAQACVEAGCHLAAVILMGSIVESSLLAVSVQRRKEANMSRCAPKSQNGKPTPVHDWTLANLIDVAHDCGWIEKDAQSFSHRLRDYRNLVHPWHQKTMDFFPNRDTCSICWEVVKATMNDLECIALR